MVDPTGPQDAVPQPYQTGYQPGYQPGYPPTGYQAGFQTQPQPGYPPVNGQVLVSIGDIACTSTEVITPSGRHPIGRVVWTFTDMSRTTRSTPTWAIVCAVIFFLFCLLGLLFLLAKEDRTEGGVLVVVQGDRFLHQTQLPVWSIAQVQDYAARVGYARSLSAAAA